MGAAHSHAWYSASENWHDLNQTFVRFSCCNTWPSKLKACPHTGPVASPICRETCHGKNVSTEQAQPWQGCAITKVSSVEPHGLTFRSCLHFRAAAVSPAFFFFKSLSFYQNVISERNPANTIIYKGKCHKDRDTFAFNPFLEFSSETNL